MAKGTAPKGPDWGEQGLRKLVTILVLLAVLAPGYAYAQETAPPLMLASASGLPVMGQGVQVAGLTETVPATGGADLLAQYSWWKPSGHRAVTVADEQARAEQGQSSPASGVSLPGLYAAPGKDDHGVLGDTDYRFAWSSHLAPPAPTQSLAAPQDDDQLRAGPFTARLLTHRGSSPGAVLPSALSGRVPSGPEAYDPQREELLQQGGYLALEWRSGPMGLTIGGGLSRTHVASAGSASEDRLLRYSLDRATSSGHRSGSGFDSGHRVAAFVAMPYQITDRFGLLPEFSYYHGQADIGTESDDNEWVMGLQFRFGF